MNKRAGPILLLLLLALVAAAPTGKAVILGPGGSNVGPGDNFNISGNFTAATGVQSFTSTTGLLTGYYEAGVYLDPTANAVCATGGCYDFLLQVYINPTSTDALGRVTLDNFTGFLTDVGYDNGYINSSPFSGTTEVSAFEEDRSLGGDTVGYGFTINQVLPGDSTYLIYIETNATSYTAGQVNLIDGGTTTVAGYAPAAFEPSVALLLPVTLLSGGLLRKKLFA